ncbi:helix-turn-helix transcriptional regulator [Joostella atrarenae]|uniref:Helix-turn-helix transcriptional regulator n=1 Tax=Joostella atrarenae TaxID=679257 RepID=A0ABS9J7R0_9FLAO|nr:AraC family transcriptional regulator [Joostella atrarenae]MCF8716445.1 helix-turn-helix transcriptional regulator [Joostella atrarenae]
MKSFKDSIVKIESSPEIKYSLACKSGINSHYMDCIYQSNVKFSNQSSSTNQVLFIYSLSFTNTNFNLKNKTYELGMWNHNLMIINGGIKTINSIQKGTHLKMLFITINKEKLKNTLLHMGYNIHKINQVLFQKNKDVMGYGRMKDNSFVKLNQLFKKKSGKANFKFHYAATVNFLLSNSMDYLMNNKTLPTEGNEYFMIISIQKELFNNLEKPFPSIKVLSQSANMSETKFKNMFKEIVGTTPSNYHLTCKLIKSKDLLKNKNLSINQISDLLKFSNSSYFSHKFRDYFGVSPTEYLKD